MTLLQIILGMLFWLAVSFAIIAALGAADRTARAASARWRRKMRAK